MARVLSEIDRDLEHAFMTASRLDYTGDRNEELGKFLIAYFLDSVVNMKTGRIDTHRIREDYARRLNGMKLLIVGGATCDYRGMFGKVDTIDNFLFMDDATKDFRGAEKETVLERDYDLIIADSFLCRVPGQHSFIEHLEDEWRMQNGVDPRELDPTKGSEYVMRVHRKIREFISEKGQGIYLSDFLNRLVAGIGKDKIAELPEDFREALREAEKLYSEMYPFVNGCLRRDYGEEILKATLKEGGILIDKRCSEQKVLRSPFGDSFSREAREEFSKFGLEMPEQPEHFVRPDYGSIMKILDKSEFRAQSETFANAYTMRPMLILKRA